MKRSRVSNKKSKRQFTKTAGNAATRAINVSAPPMRGGFRI